MPLTTPLTADRQIRRQTVHPFAKPGSPNVGGHGAPAPFVTERRKRLLTQATALHRLALAMRPASHFRCGPRIVAVWTSDRFPAPTTPAVPNSPASIVIARSESGLPHSEAALASRTRSGGLRRAAARCTASPVTGSCPEGAPATCPACSGGSRNGCAALAVRRPAATGLLSDSPPVAAFSAVPTHAGGRSISASPSGGVVGRVVRYMDQYEEVVRLKQKLLLRFSFILCILVCIETMWITTDLHGGMATKQPDDCD